jgi:hypothetical protein
LYTVWVHVEPESEPPDGQEYESDDDTVRDAEAALEPAAFWAVAEHV